MKQAKAAQRSARKALGLRKGARSACSICGENVILVADHDHETGQARGKLCRSCNAGLGMFREDCDALKRAISYLKMHRSRQGQPVLEVIQDGPLGLPYVGRFHDFYCFANLSGTYLYSAQ